MGTRRLAVGALAVAALTLAACSQGSATTGGGADAGGTGGSVTLKFQSLSDQPAAIAAVKDIVDSWNAAHPETKVEIVQAGWDGVYDKLVTQFNGNAAPDVIHYEAASIVPFARDGYLADLTSKIPAELKSDVDQGVWDSVTVDGKVVGVPTELQTYVVFANKKLIEAAGQQVPTGSSMTYDQFEALAKATTKSGQYGVSWGLKSPTATFMSLALASDGTYFEGTGKDAKITVGEGEMALPKLVKKMAYDDKSIDPVSLTQSGSQALASFYAGKAAMTVQGSYQAANMAKDAPAGVDWVELPPLAGSAGTKQAANPQTLSVNADSANVDRAAEFATYFADAENMATLNEADALIPASNKARATILSKTGGKDGWAMTMESAKGLTGAPFLTVDAYTQWKDTIATPNYQKYLANQIDDAGLQQALTDGFAQVNR
ncbi:carbohydrate ABC transporter substrate-binding protein (CUT1 family) [Terracoccus luteus]|uniref:Carbohydrate ABC transporter substrate-binding protein (CUT1 family) n=1 Tax=Terracoccus luteus TaxID=53356 RepID=A0A495XV18_9MICO|nr:sugar ABC transporter substrate-binding protein [Terracoccus luteus]RKT76714.1 carbohydrate ABC transporter substrate-binding protein (CUT1 family) [Terracoccus luteus]